MGELLNKLSTSDLEKIDNYVTDNVSSSHASVQYLLREWDKQKETLFKMFGNELILNKKIEYNKPTKTLKADLVARFSDYDNICNKFRRTFDRFLWENRLALGNDYDLLQTLMDVDRLISTTYDGPTFYVNSPEGKEIKVQNGCKPMRLISKVCRLYNVDPTGLEAFQNEVSIVLNQKKLTGDLTISIHPLDYMTMSDNECDWSSCMSWRESGCYCRGTVEMMNSPIVVVAYLNADNPMHVRGGDGQWSNKKWRELFIVDKKVITGIKGYPYQNEDLVQMVNSWLRDLAVANLGWEFEANNLKYKPDHNFTFYDENGDSHTACLNFDTHTMYNDFGTIDYHYCILGKNLGRYTFDTTYSGAEECMSCGSLDGYYESEGSLVCEDCDNRVYCSECGERIDEDCAYWLDGDPYCEYCYNEHARTDAVTGEDHHERNMTRLYLVDKGIDQFESEGEKYNYLRNGSISYIEVYNGCWNHYSYTWSRYFDADPEYCTNPNSWYSKGYYYIYANNLKSGAWDLFDACPEDYID